MVAHLALQPPLALENIDQQQGGCSHGAQRKEVTVSQVQFRHVLEVHPVQSRQKTQGNEYCRDDCENLHGGIEFM